MKVIHLIGGGDTGGAKTHIYSLLSTIGRQADVELVSFRAGEFADGARRLGINVKVMDAGFAANLKNVRREIISGGFEIVHCHGAMANLMGALLKPTIGVPVVTTVHSDYKLDYLGRPAANLIYGTLNKISLRALDYHVCVSESFRTMMAERGFNRDGLFTIYNGIDYSRELPKADRVEYFASHGFEVSEDDVIAGIAARLDPVKDMATLIRAAAKLCGDFPHFKLAIAGEGAERENLEKLARKLGIENRVMFLGWITDTDKFYASIDINALTSLSESFPYALTEGARAHLATVASRVGGVPEIIEDGRTGLLFTAGDDSELADKLRLYLADSAYRDHMGNTLYEVAKERFSEEATGARQLEIYRTILRRHEKRGRDGVLICGAYGAGNAGDEAILQAIVAQVRTVRKDARICVVTRKPKVTARKYGVSAVHTFNYPGVARRMRKTELYINGGGSLIQDITSRRSLWYYLTTIKMAKKCGCKVIMYGCGIGPIINKADEKLSARIINSYVDVITLREQASRAELERLGAVKPEIIVSCDPVLSLPVPDGEAAQKLWERVGFEPGKRYVGVSLRRWSSSRSKTGAVADAIRTLYEEHGLIPAFLSVINPQDEREMQAVADSLGGIPYLFIRGSMDAGDIAAAISRTELVISMRLHGLIFAACSARPMVGISYDPKVPAFTEYSGLGESVELDTLTANKLTEACLRVTAAGDTSAAQAALAERNEANIKALRGLIG